MPRFSRKVDLKLLPRDTTGAVSLDQAYISSMAVVGCLAVIALFSIDYSIVLDKLFLVVLSLACIGGIAVAARWHGIAKPGIDIQGKRGVSA